MLTEESPVIRRAASESIQRDLREAREILRWKTLAVEQQIQLRETQASRSWLHSRPLRALSVLRQHVKPLLLLCLILVLSVPLLPLIAICVLSKSGRDWLWRFSEHLGSAGALLRQVYARIQHKRSGLDQQPAEIEDLILDRHGPAVEGLNYNQVHSASSCLALLSPQRRHQLQRIIPAKRASMPSVGHEVLSLGMSESSLINILAGDLSPSVDGDD